MEGDPFILQRKLKTRDIKGLPSQPMTEPESQIWEQGGKETGQLPFLALLTSAEVSLPEFPLPEPPNAQKAVVDSRGHARRGIPIQPFLRLEPNTSEANTFLSKLRSLPSYSPSHPLV